MLKHEELLIFAHIGGKPYTEICSPRVIPVNSAVYNDPLSYTQAYAASVQKRLRESIVKDLEAISRVLGYGIKNFDWNKIDSVDFSVSGDKSSIDFSFMGTSNIALEPGSHVERIISEETEPNPEKYFPEKIRDKLMFFSLKENRLAVPVWYTHTPSSSGIEIELALRCFAIEFNNYGIENF